MRWSWQNLNEDSRGRPRGWPHHGRCWLSLRRLTFGAEWVLWSRSCGVDLGLSPGDRRVRASLRFPPLALYLYAEHVPGPWSLLGWEDWDIFGLAVHDWSIWWRVWHSTVSGRSSDPWWREGNWRPGRTFFGGWVYETRPIEERDIVVPMPEGEYRGRAKLTYAVRGHRWSPMKHRNYQVELELERGIPFSGKGENGWDCGEDGTIGMTCPARTIEDGIGKLVGSVLETRRRRGDPERWPVYPPPPRSAPEPSPPAEAA